MRVLLLIALSALLALPAASLAGSGNASTDSGAIVAKKTPKPSKKKLRKTGSDGSRDD